MARKQIVALLILIAFAVLFCLFIYAETKGASPRQPRACSPAGYALQAVEALADCKIANDGSVEDLYRNGDIALAPFAKGGL